MKAEDTILKSKQFSRTHHVLLFAAIYFLSVLTWLNISPIIGLNLNLNTFSAEVLYLLAGFLAVAYAYILVRKQRRQISGLSFGVFAALFAVFALLMRKACIALQFKLLQAYFSHGQLQEVALLLNEPVPVASGISFIIEAMQLVVSYFVYLVVIWIGLLLGGWVAVKKEQREVI
ncbi:hypothetical protein [Pseudovibrio sp. SCP19]|uniref:hypothetical protein n=1 Tax=Pseudovibrio sp. SCP19 TaxID=3141374 RepID=UPI0033368F23